MFELKVFTFQTCLGPRRPERQQGLFLWCTLWKKLWVTVKLTIFIVEYKSRIKYEHRLGFPFRYTNTQRIIWRMLRRGTVLIPLLVVILNHQLLRCFSGFLSFATIFGAKRSKCTSPGSPVNAQAGDRLETSWPNTKFYQIFLWSAVTEITTK